MLATNLSDFQILAGKFLGAIRRCLPSWLFLFGHVILFTVLGYIHPLALFQMAMLVAWIIVLFTGTGIYFSTRCKRTTTAVMLNIALPILIWVIVPLVWVGFCESSRSSAVPVHRYCNIIPIVHDVVIMDGAVDGGDLETFHWPGVSMDATEATLLMLPFPWDTCSLVWCLPSGPSVTSAGASFNRSVFSDVQLLPPRVSSPGWR